MCTSYLVVIEVKRLNADLLTRELAGQILIPVNNGVFREPNTRSRCT